MHSLFAFFLRRSKQGKMATTADKKTNAYIQDEEYELGTPTQDHRDVRSENHSSGFLAWWRTLSSLHAIEKNGVQPVPIELRTNKNVFEIFTLWFSMSLNLLPVVTGLVGTLSYGLSLRDCSLVILSFSLLCCVPTGYLAMLGPKTGMRQMIQARFSFGYYLVSIPVVLNMATLTGFCVIGSVTSGLTLSSVTQNGISPSVGIAIVGVLALLVSFCGFRILHLYERYAWIPTLIALVVAVGCGGKHLHQQTATAPATAANVLTFGALIAGFFLPWAPLASDFATYMPPKTSSLKIFAYTYTGLFVPSVPLMVLGAAIGGAVPNVSLWQERYTATSVGGVLAAMLEPADGFGQFLVVILSLSCLGNIAATMYSISLNFQLLVPGLVRVPRALFCIVITAIVIPISIRAAVSFFDNLENFIGVVSYWAAAFFAVVLMEHVWFRRSDCSTYDIAHWNHPKSLPHGIAAIASALLSVALIVPCMSQVWYTGPIAAHTGDIGFEMAFVVTTICYVPLRYLELQRSKR